MSAKNQQQLEPNLRYLIPFYSLRLYFFGDKFYLFISFELLTYGLSSLNFPLKFCV